jgi:hypothetical protein
MSKENENLNEPQNSALNIVDVSTRLSLMIDELDNKLQNTEYDSIFNRDCDEGDLRCLKRTLEIFKESNVC